MNRESRSRQIAVSGAFGWLGQEFSQAWIIENPDSRILNTPRLGFEPLSQFADLLEPEAPWTFLHLAFATRERLPLMGEVEYVATNQAITKGAKELIERYRPSAVVHASSGAVHNVNDLYGQLKLEQEKLLRRACDALDIPCVNARIWSVTGALCPKTENFLFYDLIKQALFAKEVQLLADHEVIRRYVDSGQFLSLMMKLAHKGLSIDIDSGGECVSAMGLARRILDILDIDKKIWQHDLSGEPDAYFSRSYNMEKLAAENSHFIGDLDWQISHSSKIFLPEENEGQNILLTQ